VRLAEMRGRVNPAKEMASTNDWNAGENRSHMSTDFIEVREGGMKSDVSRGAAQDRGGERKHTSLFSLM